MEKIVIIGGGVAGLSAGIYARFAGFDAEIFEKNPIPGGECTGWNRKGFHIDNCIHWLTGTKKGTDLYEIWNKVGGLDENTQFVNSNAFYSSISDGVKITLWADLERTKKELIAISPEDTEEIEKFIQYIELSKQCVFPAKKPMDMWTVKDYMEIGMSMKDFAAVSKEFSKVAIGDYAKRFKHPALQKLMCDYLPREYCTYAFFVSYATVADGNGNIPIGASLQMSLRMANRFTELGGKIHYNQLIQSINIERKNAGSITLADGTKVNADYIISAVDTNTLFTKLLDNQYMPKKLRIAYEKPEIYPATSGFQVAYSIPMTGERLDETVFLDIEPLSIANSVIDRMYIKTYGYDDIYCKDGKCVIQTCLTQKDADFAYWKSLNKEQYEAYKQQLVEAITERILKQYPELCGKIDYLDAWTPLTYERYCDAYHGSYMSFTTTPMGKQIKLNGRIKGVNNIYLAGQWTNSPGGLPVAAASGKFAVQRILKSKKRDIDI